MRYTVITCCTQGLLVNLNGFKYCGPDWKIGTCGLRPSFEELALAGLHLKDNGSDRKLESWCSTLLSMLTKNLRPSLPTNEKSALVPSSAAVCLRNVFGFCDFCHKKCRATDFARSPVRKGKNIAKTCQDIGISTFQQTFGWIKPLWVFVWAAIWQPFCHRIQTINGDKLAQTGTNCLWSHHANVGGIHLAALLYVELTGVILLIFSDIELPMSMSVLPWLPWFGHVWARILPCHAFKMLLCGAIEQHAQKLADLEFSTIKFDVAAHKCCR